MATIARSTVASAANVPGLLLSGQSLSPGQGLASPDGQFVLEMQSSDGNLVIYYTNGSGSLWDSGTSGHPGASLWMQATDGNLVIYPSNGKALWASGTSGHPGDYLAMQNDGNLVVYSSNGQVLWATNTGGHGASHSSSHSDQYVTFNYSVAWVLDKDGSHTSTVDSVSCAPSQSPSFGLTAADPQIASWCGATPSNQQFSGVGANWTVIASCLPTVLDFLDPGVALANVLCGFDPIKFNFEERVTFDVFGNPTGPVNLYQQQCGGFVTLRQYQQVSNCYQS